MACEAELDAMNAACGLMPALEAALYAAGEAYWDAAAAYEAGEAACWTASTAYFECLAQQPLRTDDATTAYLRAERARAKRVCDLLDDLIRRRRNPQRR